MNSRLVRVQHDDPHPQALQVRAFDGLRWRRDVVLFLPRLLVEPR